ncbi:DUF1566 domain-containing protein [Collimonas pratensis]|uniref:DUF1566 domain-containing protein n=1 Tax=Collimonas pratensis TaxID=279113 RepID=UPI00143D05C8|nr:DUF1566 domain-containing protein [Collimonas pratensis]NKI68912.1 DUF1566 domain-containing protein [Collimonas pratensis]
MSKQQWLEENQRSGETYAGLLLGKNGEPDQHIFLLPGQATDVTWQAALAFAKKIGGDLPTRREQSLLFANLKEEFEARYYWSSEQHSVNSHYAWGQYFSSGFQLNNRKVYCFRARAVRRLAI